MNFRTINENDLANFAENVNELLAGTELSAINDRVRIELVALIGGLPATLAEQTAEVAVIEGERKGAVSARNVTRAQLWLILARVRDALKSGAAPKKQYDLCGFDYPASRSIYDAQDPTNLSAFGYSNGVNTVRFRGNNKPGQVIYEMWRRHGDTVGWALHATTRKQSFTDTGIVPGQYYEYKVRAVAAKTISNFSNSAVVYGVS